MASIANKIKEAEKTLKEEQNAFLEGANLLEKQRATQAELNKTVRRMKEELAETEIKLREASIAVQQTAQLQGNRQHSIQQQETELSKNRREQKVLELVDKQRDFWDATEERLAHLLAELNQGLEGFEDKPKDPKDVCSMLRKTSEDRISFNGRTHTIRQAQHFYQESLRKICEMRIDGRQIPPSEKQARLSVLDRFLNHPDIVSLWS